MNKIWTQEKQVLLSLVITVFSLLLPEGFADFQALPGLGSGPVFASFDFSHLSYLEHLDQVG